MWQPALYVFRDDHMLLDNQLEGLSLRKTESPSFSSHSLPVVIYLGAGPCEDFPHLG